MTLRSLAFSALAVALLAPALAAAQDAPYVPAPDPAVQPETPPAEGAAGEKAPLYSRLSFGGAGSDDSWPRLDWYEQEGIDSAYDVDPRGQLYLPRPRPGLVLELR